MKRWQVNYGMISYDSELVDADTEADAKAQVTARLQADCDMVRDVDDGMGFQVYDAELVEEDAEPICELCEQAADHTRDLTIHQDCGQCSECCCDPFCPDRLPEEGSP